MSRVPKVFSLRTLGKFEDASASIPLRQIARAFEGANLHLGEDPSEGGGDRRTHFRRYVAGVDQHDPQQLARLGDAFGALIEEVAASKVEFLVKAAESDGFFFADRVFRPAETTVSSFAVTRLEDLPSIDDRGRRLHLLANDRPKEAIGGAKELVDSLCRTVLRLLGEPLPKKALSLPAIAKTTLETLGLASVGIDDAKEGTELVSRCLQQLIVFIADLNELQNVDGSAHRRDGKWKGPSTSHARLAAGAAIAFAGFVAETYAERATLKTIDGAESGRRRRRTL